MSELLPCPFCAGVVQLHHPKGASYSDITYLLCDSCGAVCSFRPNMKGSKAIAAWNRRASPPAQAVRGPLMCEAADAIERRDAEIERLRSVLESVRTSTYLRHANALAAKALGHEV